MGWGTRVIDRLADDLAAAFPEMRGLSRTNLKYMRQMASAWPESAFGPQPVGQFCTRPRSTTTCPACGAPVSAKTREFPD